MAGDLPQDMVEVRKVVDGHVSNERAANFIVTCSPVQPSKKEKTLNARGKSDDDPVGIHKSVECQDSSIEAKRKTARPKSDSEAVVRRVARAGVEQL